jgi:hypothetical protein
MSRTRGLAAAAGCAFGCLLLAGCASGPATQDAFEAHLRDAIRNASSAEGAAFEGAVGSAFREPRIRDRLRACQRADASAAQLRGTLDFLGTGAYSVDLRPRGPASDCVSRAIAAEHLPEPPRYPFSIPFRWPDRL